MPETTTQQNFDDVIETLTDEQKNIIADGVMSSMRDAFYMGVKWGFEFADDPDDPQENETGFQGYMLGRLIGAMGLGEEFRAGMGLDA